MYPVLLNLGFATIKSYGFFIAIGFLCALRVVKVLAPRSGLPENQMLDLSFYTLLVGLLGARIFFIFDSFNHFRLYPLEIFQVWKGGLSFLGGPLLCTPFLIGYARRKRLPIWKILDIMAPALAIGHCFGRIGCFLAGCCYGKFTNLPIGVKLSSEFVDSSVRGVPIHPVQLYESAGLFILFLFLNKLFRMKKFDGQVGLTYAFLYPLFRIGLEYFRGDPYEGFLTHWFSVRQTFYLACIVATIIAFYLRWNFLKLENAMPLKKSKKRKV